MKRFLMFVAMLLAANANAGFPFEASLEEMAQGADHILIGHVTGVDMIDAYGTQVKDIEARTGPGLGNTIRLLITVDEVLVTNASSVPKVLPVPLAQHLHYQLGKIQDAHADDTQSRLILLKGRDFVGVKPGLFFRPLADRAAVLRIHGESHHKAPA